MPYMFQEISLSRADSGSEESQLVDRLVKSKNKEYRGWLSQIQLQIC